MSDLSRQEFLKAATAAGLSLAVPGCVFSRPVKAEVKALPKEMRPYLFVTTASIYSHEMEVRMAEARKELQP